MADSALTDAASVIGAAEALERAAAERGWTTDRIQDSPTFRRMTIAVSDLAPVIVDLAQDGPPLSAPLVTIAGPTYPPEELAARKVLALFDRAALRDFVDVANVAEWYGTEPLLDLAAEIDEGFDRSVFCDMASTLARFSDDEIAALHPDPSALRALFTTGPAASTDGRSWSMSGTVRDASRRREPQVKTTKPPA